MQHDSSARSSTAIKGRQTLMDEGIPLPFDLPAVARKKVSAAFDGGRITSDGGVMLLTQAEHRLGIADQLAQVIPDERDASWVTHLLPDILRARIFAIACGYEDADDLDRLRGDPGFKLACGRLPDTGRDLCSQPTVSRWENAPSLRDLIRLMGVMVDLYCASKIAPAAVTLDIDDTVDVVHDHQKLSFLHPGRHPKGACARLERRVAAQCVAVVAPGLPSAGSGIAGRNQQWHGNGLYAAPCSATRGSSTQSGRRSAVRATRDAGEYSGASREFVVLLDGVTL
jgi:hypothetical protein